MALYIGILFYGIMMVASGFFATILGIVPFLGFFIILLGLVLIAREYHGRFDDLCLEYMIKWKNGETIAVNKMRVIQYTVLSLLPLYFLMALPFALVVIVGELKAWLMLGVAGMIFSFFALFAFSAMWKELYLKQRHYWFVQLIIYVLINGVGLLCFLLSLI